MEFCLFRGSSVPKAKKPAGNQFRPIPAGWARRWLGPAQQRAPAQKLVGFVFLFGWVFFQGPIFFWRGRPPPPAFPKNPLALEKRGPKKTGGPPPRKKSGGFGTPPFWFKKGSRGGGPFPHHLGGGVPAMEIFLFLAHPCPAVRHGGPTKNQTGPPQIGHGVGG